MSKVLANAKNKYVNIMINRKHLEEVANFKNLWVTLTKDGRSSTEVKTSIAIETPSMSRLLKIWKSKEINMNSKFKLYKPLVFSIGIYICESLTLSARFGKRVESFEIEYIRRLLLILWQQKKNQSFSESSSRLN